jgi:uncharacterized protein (DUF1684 family)
MTVSEAVRQRISTRAFLDEAIPKSELADLLATAQRSPSGGNLQPWKVIAVSGEAKDEIIPGEIAFTHKGHAVSLITIGTGRALQIVFADETNDSETYSVGRFLFVVPNPDGTVTLDFNLAVLPPCAFSYNFNCPIPPKQNRLPFPIRAGEKNVVTSTGELLHR